MGSLKSIIAYILCRGKNYLVETEEMEYNICQMKRRSENVMVIGIIGAGASGMAAALAAAELPEARDRKSVV